MDIEEFLAESAALMGSEEMHRFRTCIRDTAGFHLVKTDREPFLQFHRYVSDPEPRFITAWRADPKQARWYHVLVNGILGHVQNSFACVRYHEQRARKIEQAAYACFEKAGIKECLGAHSVGGDNTLALDFEYQAYVLAYRRCLDQLALGLSAFFKNDHHSFRRLPKLLEKAKPRPVAQAMSAVIDKHLNNFGFVLSAAGQTSVRDRISHYEFVPAGTMSMSSRGFLFAGGGEKLGIGAEAALLQDVLTERTASLLQCIQELLSVFLIEAEEFDCSVYGPRC